METRIDVTVCGLKTRCKQLKDILVDTGSITTIISKRDAEEIQPLIVGKQTFMTAKGSLTADFGMAKVRLMDKDLWTPIVVTEEGPNVIGVMTLELARLKVNPVTGKLEETGTLAKL